MHSPTLDEPGDLGPGGLATGAVAVRDLDQARAVGGSAYYPHRLSCVGDWADFAMHLRTIKLGPLMAGELSCTGGAPRSSR